MSKVLGISSRANLRWAQETLSRGCEHQKLVTMYSVDTGRNKAEVAEHREVTRFRASGGCFAVAASTVVSEFAHPLVRIAKRDMD